ncbi:MAG: tetratricopeptide repeat protein [Candidatus Magnetominusculus sp. LBB02]|nr:tetratricopeptide repeat protein [Candidatus Magnetominusculus sp. LBB02]
MTGNRKLSALLKSDYAVVIAISLITAFAYAGVVRNGFIDIYDDNVYVLKNAHVLGGLTFDGVRRAFTTDNDGNWFPLTWISHMADVTMFGLNPAGHHITSAVIHILSSSLLFICFKRITGSIYRGGFIAALFATHPLHVQSVAWVAERKDVLSGFFWMLTMWSYLRYVDRGGARRYILALVSFICGLMSKPMVITLPFVLLLLDYWPLRRLSAYNESNSQTASSLLIEKIPFFALSAASGVLTYHVQSAWGAVVSSDILPLKARIANALISYVKYVVMMVNPGKSAVVYPIVENFPMWQTAGAALLIASATAVSVILIKKQPYVFVGWSWYIGTFVPVIGIVQVGAAAMADRYTYIPFIGLFLIISMALPRVIVRRRAFAALLAMAVITACVVYTKRQVRYWEDSITLFERAVSVTKDNYVAHTDLGAAYSEAGNYNEAYTHYQQAIRLNYIYIPAHVNLGHLFISINRIEEAIESYKRAISLNPSSATAYNGLGVALLLQNKTLEAIPYLRTAVSLNPNLIQARNNLERALSRAVNENTPPSMLFMPQ